MVNGTITSASYLASLAPLYPCPFEATTAVFSRALPFLSFHHVDDRSLAHDGGNPFLPCGKRRQCCAKLAHNRIRRQPIADDPRINRSNIASAIPNSPNRNGPPDRGRHPRQIFTTRLIIINNIIPHREGHRRTAQTHRAFPAQSGKDSMHLVCDDASPGAVGGPSWP